MMKHIVQLEVTVGEKTYRFLCDNDSPIGSVKEAVFQINNLVAKIEEKILEEMKLKEQVIQEEVPNEQ